MRRRTENDGVVSIRSIEKILVQKYFSRALVERGECLGDFSDFIKSVTTAHTYVLPDERARHVSATVVVHFENGPTAVRFSYRISV